VKFEAENSMSNPRAFTVVELLAVVGVILLLGALSASAITVVQRTARQTTELAALRCTLQGWVGYALDNNGTLLPGFLPGLPANQGNGQPIPAQTYGGGANIAARWPWRLAPYLSGDMRVLFAGPQADMWSKLENGDPEQQLYFASLYPSFGMNSTWIGGDSERLGFLPPTLQNGQPNPLASFYLRRLAMARNPARVIVFASSRTSATIDGGIAEGYFRLESPLLMQPQWQERYDAEVPMSFGNISARYRDEACVGTIDGAVAAQGVNALRDMRRWADQADGADWRLQP
jgi:type II secretory pathway pseudopilin PulG